MTDDVHTSLGWVHNIDVFEVTCGESATNLNTVVGVKDGSFRERWCSRFADVGTQIAWVVTNTSHEVVAVLVVVATTVDNVHPKVDLGDVSSVGHSVGDVNDWVGQTSTLSRTHVVGVSIVQTDTVIVGVSTACVAWWVTNVTWLTWSTRGLSVAAFWRRVNTVEVEGRGVEAPVVVRVVGVRSRWRNAWDVAPAESEFIRCFVVVRPTHRLSEPVAEEVVVVAVVVLVVRSVVIAVVVAVPRRCTTLTTAVAVGTSSHGWIIATVGVVTFLT